MVIRGNLDVRVVDIIDSVVSVWGDGRRRLEDTACSSYLS